MLYRNRTKKNGFGAGVTPIAKYTCITLLTKQKMRYNSRITSNIIETGIWSKPAPHNPLDHSALRALSLVPCSPLKALHDTPRAEQLNHVMIQSHVSVVGLATQLYRLHRRYWSSSNLAASLGSFLVNVEVENVAEIAEDSPCARVYRKSRYPRVVDLWIHVTDSAIGLRQASTNQ